MLVTNLFLFSDIVFIIFLYQRWIYKVDAKRVNEFGFSGEMLDKPKQAQILDTPKADGKAAIEDSQPDTKEQEKESPVIQDTKESKKTK